MFLSVINQMSSDSDSDECYFQMKESDPKEHVTIESIITSLFMSLFEDYGSSEYWEERYSKSPSEQYEWFISWSYISPHIREFCSGGKALNLGAGDSPMSFDMLQDGFDEVFSTDISSSVVEKMKRMYRGEKRLKWVLSDCTNMKEFGDGEFDLVVDKGTLDALYCGTNARQSVVRTIEEIKRVLKKDSYFIDISFGSEEQRKEITEGCVGGLKHIKTIKIVNPKSGEKFNYIYILRKENNF